MDSSQGRTSVLAGREPEHARYCEEAQYNISFPVPVMLQWDYWKSAPPEVCPQAQESRTEMRVSGSKHWKERGRAVHEEELQELTQAKKDMEVLSRIQALWSCFLHIAVYGLGQIMLD